MVELYDSNKNTRGTECYSLNRILLLKHMQMLTQSLRDIANGLVVAGLRLILYVIVLCWVVGLVGGPPQMLASLNNFLIV